MFSHPVVAAHPRVMIGDKTKQDQYGYWKTVNLWDNLGGWVEENLDVVLAINAVWIMIHAEIVGFWSWFGYALYYALITDGTLPSILGSS